MDKLLELFVTRVIRRGDLKVRTASGHEFRAGDNTGTTVAIRFRDAASQRQLLRNPPLTFGELYMDQGYVIEEGTAYDLLHIALSNFSNGDMSSLLRVFHGARSMRRRWSESNDPGKSRNNVAHHYDLDGRLYSLFLDNDWQYSCAYFEHPGDSLEDAQLAKKRHIAAKLLIDAGHSVLDIGCGWGGMGLYLANVCRAKVTGVTLSEEQLSVARERAAHMGLEDRVEFRLQDYRQVPEKFDRIVSVGMLEHVGAPHLEEYFRKVAGSLKDDGVALIHTIGRSDGPGATNAWIDKYIFPGGFLPSLSELSVAVERAGLILTDVEVLRLHYAETLKAWRERFMERWDEAAAIYDERFCRMWEFYLAGSEVGFRLGQLVNFQVQVARKVDALPLTRNYITERERELRAREPRSGGFRLAGE